MNTLDTYEETEKRLADARQYALQFGADVMKTTRSYYTEDCLKLMEICRKLHQLDKDSCNYGPDKDQEAEVVSLEKKSNTIAKRMGFDWCYHQSDPRGWSLYVGKNDDLRGEAIESNYNRGIGVPIL